jgi:glycosyltransferase involved in cell wall biosynthesis
MNILQVSKADLLGGAERVAWDLFQGMRARAHASWLAVDEKRTHDDGVLQIPPRPWSRLARPLLRPDHAPPGSATRLLRVWAGNLGALRRALLAQDSFSYPGSRRLHRLTPQPPDVIHCHNLHGSYFDLRALARTKSALAVTMHDAWLLTGGCTHPLDCQRYLSGCGNCPHLHLFFRAAIVDSTALNFRRKRRALAAARLHVVAPSRWLLDKIPGTLLEPAILSRRVIHNGVDTAVFRPQNQLAARTALGLPKDALLVLHASAHPTRNVSKDFATMRAAVLRAAETLARHVLFLVVGDPSPAERPTPHTEIRFVPFTTDLQTMARFYAAADVYLQGSVADTFPNTVLEAMACGRPVVASAVGGMVEQVADGHTGFLVSGAPAERPQRMADALAALLRDHARRASMGDRALTLVRERFTLQRQLDEHEALYREIAGGAA